MFFTINLNVEWQLQNAAENHATYNKPDSPKYNESRWLNLADGGFCTMRTCKHSKNVLQAAELGVQKGKCEW